MNSNKKLFMALGLGAIALFVNNAYIQERVGEYKNLKEVKIVQTKKHIIAGTTLTSKLVKGLKVPVKYKPKSALLWKNLDGYIGQEVNVDIPARDYLLDSYFGIRRSLANRLSGLVKGDKAENYRAINLPVDESNSLARSILPGDRIDIIFTFKLPGLSNSVTTALLQNVPIIATGSYSAAEQEMGSRGRRARKYNSLTLLLSAGDASRLIYAHQSGKINILLRHEADHGTTEIAPIGSIPDILSPTDRAKVDEIVKSVAVPRLEGDKMKAQLRELFEARRKQGGGRG